jgi:acyl-CoA synthetase (AMP-forming)/AMP-acid ligase II
LTEPLTGRHWDERDTQERIQRRVALYLERGMSHGDRVFLHYGNCLEFFADLLAIWWLGGCAVPVDGRLTPFEVDTLVRAAGPRFSVWDRPPEAAMAAVLAAAGLTVLLANQEPESAVARLTPNTGAPVLDEDALILFTSGTTGQPKGVVHTHRSLRARWTSLRDCLGLAAYRNTLCLLPTHFGHGLICNCLFPWLSGQHLFILPPFRPDLLADLGRIIDAHRISFMSSVPPVWRLGLKLAQPPSAGTLERVFCGSAPLSGTLWRAVQEWTGTADVRNAYGITETASWLAGSPGAQDLEPEDGLIGPAWGGVVKILRTGTTETPPPLAEQCRPGEPGYVWVNTPALMRGYLGRDDLTSQVVSQGWFLTGDIGLIDDRGFLYLKGREREEINKGGMKVHPADIDAVVERFEGTTDVCTFACPDPLLGENVGIAVVLGSDHPDILRGLHKWTASHLAQHQMPVRWYVLPEIPRTSRGKINRRQVAEHCATLRPVDPTGTH